MSIDSKEWIIGASSDIAAPTLRLIELISNGKEFSLNDQALNFPHELSIAIFNYPLVKNDKFKEFAEATKRISSAKYAYYKKSGQFKENITKIIINVFKKHHELTDSLDHYEQIQRVRMAERMVKFIGELYNSEFYSNENLAFFCDSLLKNSEVSKISEECLITLVQIVLDRVRNEARQYKHNIHTAAILNCIETANDLCRGNGQLKKHYKDLEIIEAVKKNKSTQLSSKNEIVRQTKKTFELILSGNVPIADCIQKAYDSSIIFPDSFESEMLQLAIDYLKKSFEASDVEIMSSKCPTIVEFIGQLFNMEALSNDAIRGFLSFLSNRDSQSCKPLYITLIDVIFEKIIDEDDEILKPFIPDDYIREQTQFVELENGREENENKTNDGADNGQKEEQKRRQLSSSSSATSSAIATPHSTPKHVSKISSLPTCDGSQRPLVVTATHENLMDPFEKFKELLNKLSNTNGAYILRETTLIKFGSGEEIIKKLAMAIIEHAINKQTLIKTITEIAVKLPETIVPHFSSSLMRKHIKAVISSRIFKCSEQESTGYCQLVNALHKSNYYDRFDVIILLESFVENIESDRTALPSLLKFTNELEEVIGNKKLSKNMKTKLWNIAQILSNKKDEEIHADFKDSIEYSIKILKGETSALRENKLNQHEDDSNDDDVEISDYRYDGATDEYVISVESLPQNSAKITLLPSAKNKQQKSGSPEICTSSSIIPQNFFVPPISTQFILPPMNVPPPVMLIAPPMLLPNQTVVNLNIPPPMSPQQHLFSVMSPPPPLAPFVTLNRQSSMSFPSLLETVQSNEIVPSMTRDENQMRPQSEGFNRSVVISGDDLSVSSSSADISETQFNDMSASDDMYDTVSNATTIDTSSCAVVDVEEADNERSESAYSSLRDEQNILNEEEKFKNLIKNNFPTDIKEIEKFAEVFLVRGMKCKSRGFIKLIQNVEEGLSNNTQLYESFLRMFETKIFEFVKTLSQNDYASSCERDKSLQLILIAAETYNEGLMKSGTFFACLEVLFNDINSGKIHQITLFHQLIKITLDKIVEEKMTNVCKSYLDRLFKRVETFNDFVARNLLSWEIFVTMKLLLFRTQKARMNCPVTFFKTILGYLNGENFRMLVNELKEKMLVDKNQLTNIVDIFIDTALAGHQKIILIQLGVELSNICAIDAEDFSFIKYLESKAHHDIKICLSDTSDNQNLTNLVHWISLIGDLYLGNVASIYLILCALEMLLDKEVFNVRIVDCINVLLRKVGFKIDQESTLILDKFFSFFTHIMNSENSYRSKVYLSLVKLRSTNWVQREEEKDIEIIEDMLREMNNKDISQIALGISGLIYKSREVFKAFINMLWKVIIMNPEMILKYAKLTQAISCNYQRFGAHFFTFLHQRNQTFKSLTTDDKFNKDVKSKLSTVACFVAYCYALNCASENDLLIWMKPNFTEHFTVEERTELQLIVEEKVYTSNNNELKGYLALIEHQTRESMTSSLNSLKTILMDL